MNTDTDSTIYQADSFERCPSVLDPEHYSYKDRKWRSPKTEEDEEILLDEPGRILPPVSEEGHATDCRSITFE